MRFISFNREAVETFVFAGGRKHIVLYRPLCKGEKQNRWYCDAGYAGLHILYLGWNGKVQPITGRTIFISGNLDMRHWVYAFSDLCVIRKKIFMKRGKQLMIRSGGRICYWTAKCIMLVVETFLYFIISYGVIWIYTVLTGGTVFKNINVDLIRDYGRLEINENAINNLPVWLYLLPARMPLLLATVQMPLSFVSGVSIAYFVMLVLLLSSAYQMTQVLPGNWGMLYRSCYVMKDGFSSEKMLIFCLVSCLLCWILGGIRFCRADVLKREELG